MIAYNDAPTRYLVEEHDCFFGKGHTASSDRQHANDLHKIMFVHIREPEEIDKFKQRISTECVTILVRRKAAVQEWGNSSDDDVEDYNYDYIFDNDQPVDVSGKEFVQLITNIIGKVGCKEREGRI